MDEIIIMFPAIIPDFVFDQGNDLVDRAIVLATAMHAGQKRVQGSAYIFHPLRVLNAIAIQFPEDKILQAAAVCHDTVEDTDLTLEMLEDLLGPEVAALVDVVTRRNGETYAEMTNRISLVLKAIHLKLADLGDNMLSAVREPLPQPKQAGLLLRYAKAKEKLLKTLSKNFATPQ